MRRLEIHIHKTFVTGSLMLGHHDTSLAAGRGYKSIEEHDQSMISKLESLPKYSVLVVLGNLFSNKASDACIKSVVATLTKSERTLLCIEGNNDHKILWELHKAKQLNLIGDMAILSSNQCNAVVSFYPLEDWLQKCHGSLHLFGREDSGPGKSGGLSCAAGMLLRRAGRPVVSMQFIYETLQHRK